ncbi:MAG: porin family protein [Mesorhizobium sp.]|uniref:outer membrane protein n=1 Tax=Mesorhizobium sp. TaxID=1871066 RepID=UPI000FEA2686|nr:outer membrane protein [Mesorhizobium sp.]RWB06593.1 MAG: porin family protein [Mesorhizobium sp.]RWB13821.1 MAG: porin family protein [Mesorhizobium sp.]
MKKLLLGLSLSLLASSAFAADAMVEEVAPVFSWTGGYIGLQAGYARGEGNIRQASGPGFIETDPDGFLGGVYAGYNYQMPNNIVIGAELDVVYANVDGSGQIFAAPGLPFPGGIGTEELKWSGAARLRLGYAVDRLLPYVAGGVAFGDIDTSSNTVSGSFGDTFTGWTIGAGLDYAMTDNLLLRAEYRYTDFGTESLPTGNVDLKINEVRFGIAYKF